MAQSVELPIFVSIPHSGEQVPEEVTWLKGLPEATLMRDVDRFVDKLYEPAIKTLSLPSIITTWHRYVVDLNRKPNEYDDSAVLEAPHPSGTHPKGLHWSVTTHAETLISDPMEPELHDRLVQNYYKPFHDSVKSMRQKLKSQYGVSYHLDLHSMPSLGTAFHPDPGELRAEVVVSDQHGQSSSAKFKDLVMDSYQKAGFQVAYNWPYVGGGITKTYGEPEQDLHTVQIELNRAQYMNEETKQPDSEKFAQMQEKLTVALGLILSGLRNERNG